MAGLNASRDASYITKMKQGLAVYFNFNQALTQVNNGQTTFMKLQTPNTVSADLLQQRDVGCKECARRSNTANYLAGSNYDPNLLAIPNATPCGACGSR